MLKVLIVILFSLLSWPTFAQPTISSFSPSRGPVGTEVRILGSRFDTKPENNIVSFGGTIAYVKSASSTELKVIAPLGATYNPISVLVNGLIGYSAVPFEISFGGSGMDMYSFGASQNFDQMGGADQISVIDIDGNGKNDLLLLKNGNLSIFKNTSSAPGKVAFEPHINVLTGIELRSVAIGEIDGDGKPDLVVSSINGFYISIFRNTSDGNAISFGPQRDFNPGGVGASIRLQDLDVDGKTDIVIRSSVGLYIFRNTSEGIGHISFAPPVVFSSFYVNQLKSLFINDLNNDGKPDLAGLSNGGVFVLRNTSVVPGTISYAEQAIVPTTANVSGMQLRDLNQDGKADLVLTFYVVQDNWTYDGYFHTLNNLSSSSEIGFGSAKKTTTKNISLMQGLVSMGDLDGDGAVDLVFCDGEYFVLYRNLFQESGAVDFVYEATFEVTPRVGYGSDIRVLSVGDLDNDGKIDLIFSTNFTNYIQVFRNQIVSLANNILSFNFPGQTKPTEIDETEHTITIEMPSETELSSLVPTFALPYGASARVGVITQQSQVTINDFTSPVLYTVTAEDGARTQVWNVIVSKEIVTALDENRNRHSLYPNPVYNEFTITGIQAETNISILDYTGRIHAGKRLPNSENFDIGNLPKGLYLVIVNSGKEEQRIKIVKE